MDNWASIASLLSSASFWLVCYMPLARSSRIFLAYSRATHEAAARQRVKIIDRCGVASLRRSNRCGSPPLANRLLAAG